MATNAVLVSGDTIRHHVTIYVSPNDINELEQSIHIVGIPSSRLRFANGPWASRPSRGRPVRVRRRGTCA